MKQVKRKRGLTGEGRAASAAPPSFAVVVAELWAPSAETPGQARGGAVRVSAFSLQRAAAVGCSRAKVPAAHQRDGTGILGRVQRNKRFGPDWLLPGSGVITPPVWAEESPQRPKPGVVRRQHRGRAGPRLDPVPALSGLGHELGSVWTCCVPDGPVWGSVHLCVQHLLGRTRGVPLPGLPCPGPSQAEGLRYIQGWSDHLCSSPSLLELLTEVDLPGNEGCERLQAPSKAFARYCICHFEFFFKRGLPTLFKLQAQRPGHFSTKFLPHKPGSGGRPLPAHRQLCTVRGQPVTPGESNRQTEPTRGPPPCLLGQGF